MLITHMQQVDLETDVYLDIICGVNYMFLKCFIIALFCFLTFTDRVFLCSTSQNCMTGIL